MATKFGYVERNIENDVNWGEVGKGFADMLVSEREERQAKKDLLDDAMIKTQDELKKAPLGYNTDFNDRIIGLADNASSYLLAANKDLKAGRITPAEYMRKVQRMNSSADQIFNLSNNYNKLYEEHLNRLDSGVSGKVEQQIFEDISNMTNFNENDFFIDSTGAIVAAPLVTDKNGITTIDPSRARSAQAMFNLAQNFVNKVDVEAKAKKSADRLATYIVSESTAADYKNKGRTEAFNDIRKKPGYQELKKSLIDGILDSDLSTSSVLADYIGGYDVVTRRGELSKDPAERENQVYIDISNGREGRAELTESQKKIAEERIGLVLEGMINSEYELKETEKKEYPKTPKNSNNDSGFVPNDFAKYMAMLWYGDQDQVEKSENYLKSLNDKIQRIKRTPDGVSIYYKGGKEAEYRPFKNSDGEIIPQRDWLIGNTNYFLSKGNQIKDANTILNTMNFDPTQRLSDVTAEAKSLSSLEVAKDYINSDSFEVTDETFTEFDEDSVKKALTPILNKYTEGATITTGTFDNSVTIKIPNQPNLELSSDNTAEENIRLLKEFLANNVNPNKSAILMQTGEIQTGEKEKAY